MTGGARRWKLLKLALGYGLAAAAVYFTVARFEVSAAEVWQSFSGPRGSVVVAALLLFTLHGAMNAFAFGYLVRSFGAGVPLAGSAAAWAGSVLAKYVPGGAWHIVGRGVMLGRHGVGPRVSLWTALIEQGLSLLACLAVVLFASALRSGDGASSAWLVGPALLLLALGLPWVLPSRVGLSRHGAFLVAALTYSAALAPYAVAYLLLATPANPLGFVHGLFEGTIAGVLAFFAPGGLGVRESWMVLSQSEAGDRGLLGVLILARALILLSEVALTLAAMAFNRRHAASDGGAA